MHGHLPMTLDSPMLAIGCCRFQLLQGIWRVFIRWSDFLSHFIILLWLLTAERCEILCGLLRLINNSPDRLLCHLWLLLVILETTSDIGRAHWTFLAFFYAEGLSRHFFHLCTNQLRSLYFHEALTWAALFDLVPETYGRARHLVLWWLVWDRVFLRCASNLRSCAFCCISRGGHVLLLGGACRCAGHLLILG